jgi:predicted RNase H-like nuclease (RuvC/YqgF family)
MKVEKSLIKISGRNSLEKNQQRKMSMKEYKEALEKSTKKSEDFSDEIKELKYILTQHKLQLESSSKAVAELKHLMVSSTGQMKSMLSTHLLFLQFVKNTEELSLHSP